MDNFVSEVASTKVISQFCICIIGQEVSPEASVHSQKGNSALKEDSLDHWGKSGVSKLKSDLLSRKEVFSLWGNWISLADPIKVTICARRYLMPRKDQHPITL